MPASVVAGVVVERLGIRLCLFICTPILSFTWIMIAQGAHFKVLVIARMIQGVVGKPFRTSFIDTYKRTSVLKNAVKLNSLSMIFC